MSDLVQKKFRFEQVNSYGIVDITVPAGYQFFQFLERKMNDMTEIIAVFIENVPLQEMITELEKNKVEEIASYKKFQDAEFEKRVGNMQLEKTFSDIITKFKIGDSVYYYTDYVGSYEKIEEIEDHIKSFSLNSVRLWKTEVELKGVVEENDSELNLVLEGWNEEIRPEKAFKTKQEAIDGSKEYHEARMKKIQDEKDNAIKSAEERKKKEEDEILRKAEEIKNKNK